MINIEKLIAHQIASANGYAITELGLRFDRAVVRFLGNLRTHVAGFNLKEETILMTITSPIRFPSKTQNEIEIQIGELLRFENSGLDSVIIIGQNEIRLKKVKSSSKHSEKFVGLVHNPETSAQLLLNLASKWLTES